MQISRLDIGLWAKDTCRLMLLCLIWSASGLSTMHGNAQTETSIPHDEQIADFTGVLRYIGRSASYREYVEFMIWPDKNRLKRFIPPEEDVPQKERLEWAAWLRHVLREEWVPPNLENLLIPLRAYRGKHDYFGVRYAVGKVKFQILVGPFFRMLVSDPDHVATPASTPASFDLGGRKYLRLPEGLVP